MAGINVGKILQEIVVPELHDIKTKVSTIEVEIKRLDEKIGSMDKRLDDKIDGLDKRLDAMENRLGGMEKYLTSAIDVHERLAAIEAKIGLH